MAGWENAFGEIATAAKQDTQQTTLAAIQTAAEALLTAAAAIKVATEALNTKTTTVNTGAIAGTVAVSNLPGTQPVSATSLPLPSGAATEATLAAIRTATEALNTGAIAGTVALDAPTLAALENTSVAVSNFPATQPVSATSLPLPTGAATEITLAAIQSAAATEATLTALNETTQSVRDLNDTIVVLMSAIFEKMPRVTGNDQAAVSVETGTVAVSSLPTLANVTTLANQNAVGGKFISGDNAMMGGASYIYNQITVS